MNEAKTHPGRVELCRFSNASLLLCEMGLGRNSYSSRQGPEVATIPLPRRQSQLPPATDRQSSVPQLSTCEGSMFDEDSSDTHSNNTGVCYYWPCEMDLDEPYII